MRVFLNCQVRSKKDPDYLHRLGVEVCVIDVDEDGWQVELPLPDGTWEPFCFMASALAFDIPNMYRHLRDLEARVMRLEATAVVVDKL